MRHKTMWMTPQQNGLVERMNRTILERVRSMLSNAKLPTSFWAEAVNTAVYLINRCPSSAIEFKTPMEKWSKHAPDLSNLKVFGCTSYVHVNEGKLHPRSMKCIFLGYPKGVKGYRLWNPNTRKCVISRDVVFKESEMLGLAKDGESSSGGEVDKETFDLGIEDNPRKKETQEEHHDTQMAQEQLDEVVAHTNEEVVDVDNLHDYNLARDRERRQSKAPVRYGFADCIAYALEVAEEMDSEPNTFEEALASKDSVKWKAAMDEEMDSLHRNQTWKLVDKPKGGRVVGCKWVFKKKEGVPRVKASRFKARLVAKGYTQKEGVDFNEIFSPVVRHTSIRILLSLVVHKGLELHQLDIKTAFLHGDLEEEIYMAQPEGYARGAKVCLLQKSLYGLRQSSRQWYKKFDKFMASRGARLIFVCITKGCRMGSSFISCCMLMIC